jgi:hypothetical protein
VPALVLALLALLAVAFTLKLCASSAHVKHTCHLAM